MKNRLIYLLGFLVTLFGCDPAKRITIKNLTNEKASMAWIYHKNSLNGIENPFLAQDTILITFSGDENERKKNMYFGIGGWSDNALSELLINIESLEVSGIKTKMKLNNKKEIKQFLLKRRKGVFKNRIAIEIK